MAMIALLAETAAEAGDKPFPPFNPEYWESQAFWIIVSFAVLYVVLSRLILPKFANTMERRSSSIASNLDDAARLNDEATEAQQALSLAMAKARNEARETAAKTQAQIDATMREQTAHADEQIEAKLAEAEDTIKKMRSEAMAKVEDIATDTAQTLVARLGAKATASDARSAVKSALSQ